MSGVVKRRAARVMSMEVCQLQESLEMRVSRFLDHWLYLPMRFILKVG